MPNGPVTPNFASASSWQGIPFCEGLLGPNRAKQSHAEFPAETVERLSSWRVTSPADRKCEQRTGALAVRFLEREKDLEDGQSRARLHIVRGDEKPVPPVMHGHLSIAGPALLRVDEEVSGRHLCPIEWQSVRAGRHRRDSRLQVLLWDTHALGEEGHDLQDGS